MGKVLFFEPFNGASGDMIVGALLDLGMPLDHLSSQLAHLGISSEFELRAEVVNRQGLKATDFQVICGAGKEIDKSHRHVHHHGESGPSRNLQQINRLIESSSLDPKIKETSLLIFRRLGEAEARVHGTAVEDVHFHEVGAVDSIVDIVGASVGFAFFGIQQFFTSRIALGGGTVHFSHGNWPVPAPATLELIRGVPTQPGPVDSELLTPTGAAIITSLAKTGPVPGLRPRSWGFGAGSKQFDSIPNLLRLTLGESLSKSDSRDQAMPVESVVVLEATLDNMDGELLGHFMEMALSEGALDVYYSMLQMKKNRPGVLLTLLCRKPDQERFSHLIFRETRTLGLRRSARERVSLDREHRNVDTPYGTVRVKVGKMGDRIVNIWPEYEDLKTLSLEKGVPLKVLRLAVAHQLKLYD